MDKKGAQEIIDKSLMGIFGVKNRLSVEEVMEKFAFDIKLPVMVHDSTTGEETWAESLNPLKYITQENQEKRESWMLPKRRVGSIDDIIEIWKETNYVTTERNYNSEEVAQSDTIYGSEKVWRSANCNGCRQIAFCDGCHHCEYTVASQRSGNCTFCLRVDDSANCNNSYNVVCSGKISNSLIIQDCNSLHECMFCSHISNRRYCIANMQFEKEEYFEIKGEVVKWILGL